MAEKTTIPETPRSPTVGNGLARGRGASAADVIAEFGNYEILEEVARGGVGIVYKARQKGLNRVVALKVLQSGISASPEQVQRFLHEARAAAKLQHPNIVPIHDFGVWEGQHYFTMDFVEGESLAEIVSRGPMHVREALAMAREVATALQYAHEQGVVHRDVKPGNVLIDSQGRVRVTDFGLAKELRGEQLNLTVTGQVMGTPRYMSPEQASGRTAQADARSDVFSLGASLYEMVTGRPAFGGENVVEILQQILEVDPVPPHRVNPKVHRDVSTICGKAMEKAPERRYASALELRQDIDRFLAGEPIEAKPVGPVMRLGRKLRPHAKTLLVLAVVIFLTINGVVLALNARPGMLRLSVQPPGARVILDGVELTAAELAEGKELRGRAQYRLWVEKEPEFDPQSFTFSMRPGELRSLAVTLPRRMATVRIRTDPADAGVTIVSEAGYRATFQGPRIEQTLPTDEYTLLAHKENYLAQDATVLLRAGETRELDFTLPPITLWATPTSGTVLSVPVVADFDGDRAQDVAVGDDDGKIYCFSGRNGVPIWVFHTGNAVQAPLAAADLNGDGRPDVVVGSTDRTLYAVDGRHGRLLWRLDTKGPIVGPTLLHDLNGDRVADAIVGSDDGSLYAVNGRSGALLWQFSTGGRIQSCLALWQNSQELVVLAGTLGGTLHAVHAATGQSLWQVKVGRPLAFPPRLEDRAAPGEVVALLPTPLAPGDARTRTPVSLSSREVGAPAAAFPVWMDLDGDGEAERLVAQEQGTTCYRREQILWETPYVVVAPYFADVDGDGMLDVIFNNGLEQVLCLSGRNGLALGRITLEAGVGRGYALDDVDRDGVPDVVVGAGRKLFCLAWNGGRKQWFTRAATYYDAAFAVAGGKVFTKTIGGQIAAYTPEQQVPLWQVETSPQPSPYVGVGADATRVADTDARTRRLTVRDAATGQPLWIARLPGEPDSAIGWPVFLGADLVVGDGDTGLHCFDAASGQLRWQQSLARVTARVAADERSVFVADGVNGLHCLARTDGKVRWSYEVSDPFGGPPLLLDLTGDGVGDVVAAADNGVVYAFNGRDGTRLWETRIGELRTRTRHRVVWAGHGLDGFVVNLAGDIHRLDLKTGTPRWKFPVGSMVMGEPVVGDVDGDGMADVLVGTMNRRLHCVSGHGDRELWSYEVGAPIRYGAPALWENWVLVGTGPPENGLYCLSARAPKTEPVFWTGPWRAVIKLTR